MQARLKFVLKTLTNLENVTSAVVYRINSALVFKNETSEVANRITVMNGGSCCFSQVYQLRD